MAPCAWFALRSRPIHQDGAVAATQEHAEPAAQWCSCCGHARESGAKVAQSATGVASFSEVLATHGGASAGARVEGLEFAVKWVWLKIKQGGLRRFWSMFLLTRATHFGTGFLSHSHVFSGSAQALHALPDIYLQCPGGDARALPRSRMNRSVCASRCLAQPLDIFSRCWHIIARLALDRFLFLTSVEQMPYMLFTT